MPSRCRALPLFVPRTVTTLPRTVTLTSPASTPGSSRRMRRRSPSSTTSTLGSHADVGETTGLLLSTKIEKRRFSSRWRRDSSIIGPKNLRRRIRCGSLRRLGVGAAEKVLELAQELVHVLELSVDRREADVGDLVELAEAVHDARSDVGRRHLTLLGVVQMSFDLIHDCVELSGRNRPLLARLHEPGAKLPSIETFPPAVLLDDHVRDFLDRLIGRETATAGFAFPSPADHLSLAALARVHHAIIHRAAERTFHRGPLWARKRGNGEGKTRWSFPLSRSTFPASPALPALPRSSRASA